jgi:hypothetical protein
LYRLFLTLLPPAPPEDKTPTQRDAQQEHPHRLQQAEDASPIGRRYDFAPVTATIPDMGTNGVCGDKLKQSNPFTNKKLLKNILIRDKQSIFAARFNNHGLN